MSACVAGALRYGYEQRAAALIVRCVLPGGLRRRALPGSANSSKAPEMGERDVMRECGMGRSRQRFNANAGRCTQNTRMGLGMAGWFTADIALSHPGEPWRCG